MSETQRQIHSTKISDKLNAARIANENHETFVKMANEALKNQ